MQKAFDVIRHELLLDHLHQLELRGAWWQLKASAYTDLRESHVAWQDVRGLSCTDLDRVHSTAYPSPYDYLSCLCKLLFISSSTPGGYSIGSIQVTTPTCTDDMIIMASSALQLQAFIIPASIHANEQSYVIHPQNTVIVLFNISSEDHLDFLTGEMVWMINGVNVPVEKMIHLGI